MSLVAMSTREGSGRGRGVVRGQGEGGQGERDGGPVSGLHSPPGAAVRVYVHVARGEEAAGVRGALRVSGQERERVGGEGGRDSVITQCGGRDVR
jgi:hypothetical protein